MMFNPPNIWATINLADVHNPIAQVMTGSDINLNKFNPKAGPTSTERAINIVRDPYAASHYFHFVIKIILEEIFGIDVKKAGTIH